jgi:hypothetical protein
MLARVAHCTAKPGQAGEVARLLREVSEMIPQVQELVAAWASPVDLEPVEP